MAKSKHYTVKFRRKRKGLTNYKKRLELLKSRTTRLVVRRSERNIVAQFINYKENGDNVLFTFKSSGLKKLGWKISTGNIPAAYLTGLQLATLAKGNVKNAILDLGLQRPVAGSRLYAVLKGIIDGGIKVPLDETVFPSEERLTGTHIQTHIETNKNSTQFSQYKKDGITTIKPLLEECKKKILGN
ncbi:50S ribosomal protein L18 [Candidatus Woesearchaeota archaeon]|mgnify:CR=1 FL=1|nr:50S ribosomal protein L18 [Candidatus Woesearchaeota archaeon]|tara:strand:- start:204 stop:761 length:558 start_codon:yes stop_codon:yes gene_type:complete